MQKVKGGRARGAPEMARGQPPEPLLKGHRQGPNALKTDLGPRLLGFWYPVGIRAGADAGPGSCHCLGHTT